MKNKEKGIVSSGFVQANNEIMLKIVKDCDAATYVTYLRVLSHRNTSNNQCFPTIQLLAEECGSSISTIKRQLKNLKDKGYLLHQKGNSRYANQYYFPMEPFYKGQGKPQPQNNNEYINVEAEQEKKEMKYIPTNQEMEVLEALRKQEAIERKQPKHEPQQPYNETTDEEIIAAFAEYDLQQKQQQQPKPQPKQKQEFNINVWVNQPYTFTGKGA